MKSSLSRTNASALIVSLSVAGALLVTPASTAQDAPGTLFLSATSVGTITAPDCQTMPVYGMLDSVQPAASGKAYLSISTPALSCPTFWEYTATAPFVLSGVASLRLFVSCDAAALDGGVDGVLASFGGNLLKDGEGIGEQQFFEPLMGPCTAGSVAEILLQGIDTGDTPFEPGQRLGISLMLFAGPTEPTTAKNLHILTEGEAHPSALSAAGLPLGRMGDSGSPPIVESLVLSAEADSVEAEAGSAASYALSLLNQGTEDASYTLSVLGLPEGYVASFDSSSGTIVAGGTAAIALDVEIPPDAESQSISFEVAASGPNGGSANVSLTLAVAAGGGSSSGPSSTPTAGPEESSAPTESTDATSSAAANGTAQGDDDHAEENGIPSLPAAGLLAALAAGVVLLRRRKL